MYNIIIGPNATNSFRQISLIIVFSVKDLISDIWGTQTRINNNLQI